MSQFLMVLLSSSGGNILDRSSGWPTHKPRTVISCTPSGFVVKPDGRDTGSGLLGLSANTSEAKALDSSPPTRTTP